MRKIPRAPSNLQKAGKVFWKKIHSEYLFETAHDLERLVQACGCLDQIAGGEARIKEEGLFQKDRYGQIKEHCAVKLIRDNRILFARLIREIGLDLEKPKESRPPRQY